MIIKYKLQDNPTIHYAKVVIDTLEIKDMKQILK